MHILLGLLTLFVLVPLALFAFVWTFKNAGNLAEIPAIKKIGEVLVQLLGGKR